MSHLAPHIDPEGLLEYSVVFSDRSLNHMSAAFKKVMQDIAATLREVYRAKAVALVPGGGTFGMEAVARQFATGKSCLVLRNGWFSYRWTQIFEMGSIPRTSTVLKARRLSAEKSSPFLPAPVEEVLETIDSKKPSVLFAPHVETASGMILPAPYLREIADTLHRKGGLFVLDAIASGAAWVDMEALGVDVLLSAPQKGWSASPSCALIMLSERALHELENSPSSTSFACDLKKWLQIMQAYEKGGQAYHATLPTDALARLRDTMLEIKQHGFERVQQLQWELGRKARDLLQAYGYCSVAAEGYEAPGVVVSYTDDDDIQNGSKFIRLGLQTAAGVPLMCDEGSDFKSFRIGLFGLDKLLNIERTTANLKKALESLS